VVATRFALRLILAARSFLGGGPDLVSRMTIHSPPSFAIVGGRLPFFKIPIAPRAPWGRCSGPV